MVGSVRAGTEDIAPQPGDPNAAHMIEPRRPSFAVYPLVGLAYFWAAVLAIDLSSEVGNIASFWTAGAILLTALIRCRVQNWPGLITAAATADLTANILMGGTLIASVGITIFDMLEPLAIVLALRISWDGRPWFASTRWIIVFSTSSIAASFAAATFGSMWLHTYGEASFWTVWQTWAIADAIGLFVVTPFLLSWTDPALRGPVTRPQALELAGGGAILALAAVAVFAGTLPFMFVLFPILVFLAVRGSLLGATTGVLIVAMIGSWFTLRGAGPIASLASSSSERVLLLQLFLFSAVVAPLSIALIMAQRRRLADSLLEQTAISQAALDNMPQGLSMFDKEQRLVSCNRRYVDLYRLPSDLCSRNPSLNELLEYRTQHGIYAGSPKEYLRELELSDRPNTVSEISLADGRIIEIKRSLLPTGGWVSTHEDVTQQRQTEQRVRHLARHDPLTGLCNRSYFGEQLDQALALRSRGQSFALHSIDLDRFKEVNDTLGHPAGDEILKEVAERLKAALRDGDLVGRQGGDEFSILQSVSSPKEAITLAKRILDVLRMPFDSTGYPTVIGATIGIAISNAETDSSVEMMKRSDLALYRAKGDGRNRYQLFEPGMDALLQAQRQLEHELSRAITNDELELVFQPISNLASQEIVGFEALIRWNHPVRGVVAPLDFIALAEERGLIISVGQWVLRRACKEASNWPGDLRVAVNLSPVQFKAKGLVEAVSSALADSGIDPDRLELEVTESVLLLDSESVLRTFRQLKALGLKLAMDDFGTGYSSLGNLRSFPFDKIKIDQSFVRGIRNDDCLAIVQATVALATRLGMTTTAEGVETAQQLAMVRLEGCTEAQGFHISKPLPSAAVPAFLRQQRRNDSRPWQVARAQELPRRRLANR